MKIILQTILGLALLVTGFALGYPIGKIAGFSNGCEWAMVQVEIVAREAGMFMPVHMEDGVFIVKLKQPRNLHQRTWEVADHFEELAIGANCDMRLLDRAQVARSDHITQ
jgi:hypothetical protein